MPHEDWRYVHKEILDQLASEDIKNFWGLLAFGHFGASSSSAFDLFDLFSSWGVIHLLVLSGSQIIHLANMSRFIFRWVMPTWRKQRWYSLFESTFILFILGFYVVEADFPEPLVRAFLCFGLATVVPFGSSNLRVVIAFLLHSACFPNQLSSLSFVLSWVSYLMLIFAGQKQWSRFATLTSLSVGCQFLVVFLKGVPIPDFSTWCQIIIGNLLLVGVFEFLVFPMVAFSLLVSLLSWVVGEAPLLSWVLDCLFSFVSGFYNAFGYGLLGSLESIRYIVGYDL